MRADFETRTVMVLQQEAERMANAAERVRLVVRALAMRRGLRSSETCENEFFEPG